MYSYRYEDRSTVVANAPFSSRAEFLQMTLAAHGIMATTAPCNIYPSVDFVEGVGVSVRVEDALRARQILNALGLGDDPDPPPTAAETIE